jgi:hypothetical protein
MAHAPTTISGAVGEKSMGKPAPNKPDDVKKIQGLLRKAFGLLAPVLRDGIYDAAMKNAIAEFQKLWGGVPDSTVDPHGQTLKRLDRMANPLVLKPITMGLVAKGGYIIAFTTCDGGPFPAAGKGYTLHLCFSDEKNAIEVTDRPSSDLLSKDNLGAVLTIFEKLRCWATPVQCRLQLRYKGTTISTSDPQVLTAPVQPHNGRMLPLDEENNGPKLTYQGDPDAKDFHGRMFAQVAGYDKCVFVWAGKFETSNTYRGFDCITYAGTTCGASNSHMAESADLAASLGATVVDHTRTVKDPKTGKVTSVKVQLDAADPAYVKEFFAATTAGYFLLYSGGHIVIVADGIVHEFKASTPSGYNRTEAAKWLEPYKTMKLTVRKLPGKPARAV